MATPVFPTSQPVAAPSFALLRPPPLRPAALLLAIVTAVGALSSVLYGLKHARHSRFADNAHAAQNSPTEQANDKADDKDDPSQIDTIVLGDPADAPVPARKGDHVSPVHPTILIHLPRFGDQTGRIPSSDAGRLLYAWLAAFNQASPASLATALPTIASPASAAAQMELRRQTGGFALLSAKEVQPGILVFRLRDQTPSATEVLGTLQMSPDAIPAAVSTFSLRAVPTARPDSTATPASAITASPN